MKTEQQIKDARTILCNKMSVIGMSTDQLTLLRGMSTALQWACEDGGKALQDLIDGRPMEVGKTAIQAAAEVGFYGKERKGISADEFG